VPCARVIARCTTGSIQLHDQLVRGSDGHEPRLPAWVHQTEVIFDFWFADVSESALERNRSSIDVGQRIQDETPRSASPCNAACARARTTRAACPCGARLGNTSSTSCCMPICALARTGLTG